MEELNWWESGTSVPDADATRAPDLQQTTFGRFRALLATNSAVSGLFAGALAGFGACVIQGLAYPPSPERPASAWVLAVVAVVLMGALVPSWPELTAGSFAAGLRRAARGVGVAVVVALVVVVVLNGVFVSSTEPGAPLPLWLVLLLWLTVALSAGAASGAGRGVRALLAGLAGGIDGGALGGLLYWALASPATSTDGDLVMDGLAPGVLSAVVLAAAVIGGAVGLADRSARRAALVMIDGPLAGRTYNLQKSVVAVGTAAAADVAVPTGDPWLPCHLQLSVGREGVVVTPFGPVRVNGLVVEDPVRLGPEDVIQVGRSYFGVQLTSRSSRRRSAVETAPDSEPSGAGPLTSSREH